MNRSKTRLNLVLEAMEAKEAREVLKDESAEMEKRTKIAQTKVLDVRNSTKNAYFAACHDSRQNSVNCPETKKKLLQDSAIGNVLYALFYKDCATSTVQCALRYKPCAISTVL